METARRRFSTRILHNWLSLLDPTIVILESVVGHAALRNALHKLLTRVQHDDLVVEAVRHRYLLQVVVGRWLCQIIIKRVLLSVVA